MGLAAATILYTYIVFTDEALFVVARSTDQKFWVEENVSHEQSSWSTHLYLSRVLFIRAICLMIIFVLFMI